MEEYKSKKFGVYIKYLFKQSNIGIFIQAMLHLRKFQNWKLSSI